NCKGSWIIHQRRGDESHCGCNRYLRTDVTMPIASLTLELRIEGAHSLKDKRQVVRSLKDKLRAHFNVSVAELEETDLWQRATIGVVAVSSSKDYLQGQMQLIEKQAVRTANDNGAEVVDAFVEYL